MTTTSYYRGEVLAAADLNSDFSKSVAKSGDTMTGALILSGDPTSSSMAATKRYVDNAISAAFGGTASATVVVSDTPPVPTPNELWFDSVGGQLYIYYNDGNSAQWVNTTNAGVGPSVTVSDTPPVGAAASTFWFDSVGLSLYVYYNDGNSTQWIPATNQSASLGDAPSDGTYYVRRNAAWVAQPSTNVLSSQVGPVGNGADTTEDTLFTYTLAANALVGKNLRVRLGLHTSASANNKVIKFYFGSAVLYNTSSAASSQTVVQEYNFSYAGSNTQYMNGSAAVATSSLTFANATPQSAQGALSQTDSAPIVIKLTGQNTTTAAANVVIGDYMTVELL